MCLEYRKYTDKIKSYCKNNNLDFTKLSRTIKGCGDNDIIFQHFDEEKGKLGLLDETPMPIVLILRDTSSGLVFEQTEYTAQYLS